MSRSRTVVLDDDPTGSQSATRVPVVLRPDEATFARVLAGHPALYVLTNTRALTERAAVDLVRTVRRDALTAAGGLGLDVDFVLRGDSTLRGHVFAESDVFLDADGVILFAPAFPAGGRVTRGGIHRVHIDGRDVPASETEFARDPVFGYRSRTMPEYVAETGGGRACTLVRLDDLRARGPAAVTEALRSAPPGSAVVPDAETDADLAAVYQGLTIARRHRTVVVRCGAPLAALCAGALSDGTLPTPVGRGPGPLLVVCGSHTGMTTRQMARLTERYGPYVTVPTDDALADPEATAARVAGEARAALRAHGIASIASERVRRPEHDGLDHGERVMRALTGAVRRLRGEVAGVVAKGGITSAETARTGLGASVATVRGQILPGISLWDLPRDDGATLPYAVVPGNVGADDTLVRVVEAFGP